MNFISVRRAYLRRFMKKLNDLVHCTAEIFFVPGSKNSIALNTYAFDTLKINNEVVNVEELYILMKKQYQFAD